MSSIKPESFKVMQDILRAEFGPAVTLAVSEAGFTLDVPVDSVEHGKMPEITHKLSMLIHDEHEKQFFMSDCRLYTVLLDTKGHRHVAVTAGIQTEPDEVLIENTREYFERAIVTGNLLTHAKHKIRFKGVDEVRLARTVGDAHKAVSEFTEFGYSF